MTYFIIYINNKPTINFKYYFLIIIKPVGKEFNKILLKI